MTAVRSSLLVVDDEPANLSLLAGLLNTEHRVRLAPGGQRALELARREPPDLVLLDVVMPDMDGYAVCRELKRDPRTRDVPVIFVSAMSEVDEETRGFEAGAADYIHKPISPPVLRARVRTHLQVKAWQDSLHRRNAGLEAQLGERIGQLERLRDATLYAMVSLAEFRDSDTGNHVRRTQEYVRVLAEHLRSTGHPALAAADDETIELLAKSAPLHDIGKVAIPDHILLKPGPLDADAFETMKTHAMQGFEILRRAAERMGGDSGFLGYAMEIARHHHERWDGRGYPDGLAGEAIPVSARLMAVADVYDALISRRPYKEPMSHGEAMRRLDGGAGAHFDPQVVAAAHACEPAFIEIARQWHD